MNFGLMFCFRNPPQWQRPFAQFYAEQLAHVRLAEELGYDTIWLSEHHFSEDGYSPSLLPIAGAIATMTTRVRIGANLIVLPLHNAIRIAEDAATVDVLSNGRLDLGFGRGYSRSEFDGYGISRAERGSRLNEGLAVIEGLWREECFNFEGRHYRIKDARLMPKPVQRPRPPIWIGTHGPQTMNLMAQRGYHYLGNGDAALQGMVDASLQKHGRDVDELHAGHLCWVHVAETESQAWQNVEPHLHYMHSTYGRWLAEAGDLPPEQRPPVLPLPPDTRHALGDEIGVMAIGTADQVAARLDRLRREARTTHLILGMHIAGLHPDKTRTSIELFANKVMPQLR